MKAAEFKSKAISKTRLAKYRTIDKKIKELLRMENGLFAQRKKLEAERKKLIGEDIMVCGMLSQAHWTVRSSSDGWFFEAKEKLQHACFSDLCRLWACDYHDSIDLPYGLTLRTDDGEMSLFVPADALLLVGQMKLNIDTSGLDKTVEKLTQELRNATQVRDLFLKGSNRA